MSAFPVGRPQAALTLERGDGAEPRALPRAGRRAHMVSRRGQIGRRTGRAGLLVAPRDLRRPRDVLPGNTLRIHPARETHFLTTSTRTATGRTGTAATSSAGARNVS